MSDPAEIEFKIDGQYENEKGVFTVISMEKDQMVIRWENGEEIRTEIDLQRRIAERRIWEQQNRPAKAKSAAKSQAATGPSAKKTIFGGFAPTDFKKSAAGTSWRSRRQLGAAIIRKIDTLRFKFNSWAFSHKAEMHVQDVKQRSHGVPDFQAKFFVRLDQQALYHGFSIARPASGDGESDDWTAFCNWLPLEKNEQMLRTIALKDNLRCELVTTGGGNLVADESGWQAGALSEQTEKQPLSSFLEEVPDTEACGLEFFATTDKIDALAREHDIAADIARLFTQLLPLYQAAVTH